MQIQLKVQGKQRQNKNHKYAISTKSSLRQIIVYLSRVFFLNLEECINSKGEGIHPN